MPARILVVDDVEINVRLLEAKLASEYYNVISAPDGPTGLALARTEHPDLGKWSLPGSFLRMDESLEEAAARALKTKVGIEGIFLEQLYTFGQPDRDPRTRVIAVAYYALVHADR